MNDMNVPRPNNLDAYWMPFTDNRYFKDDPRMFARAEGMYYFTADGREILDGTAGLWCVQCRPWPAADRRGHPAAGGASSTMRRPSRWATRWPSSWRRALARAGAGGPGPGLLHQFRLGERRYRAEDRAGLSPGAGRGQRDPADRARARLPRRRLRRHLGGRHRRQPQACSAPCCPTSTTCRIPMTWPRTPSPRPARARRASGRRAGAPGRAARRRDHRGGDRRADGGLDRRAGAAEGLPGTAARDLRPSTASC